MPRDPLYWSTQFKDIGALWFHNGHKDQPHAIVTSEKHSGGYFNGEVVFENAFLADQACSDLLLRLREEGLVCSGIDRVVGTAMGSITMAHEVAYHVATKNMRHCMTSYTEKRGSGPNKVLCFNRMPPHQNDRVLQVDDALSTGDTIEKGAQAIMSYGARLFPFVGVLVNRSGLRELNGRKIVSLIDHPIEMFPATDCPLCGMGSKAVRPKGRENWSQFVGDPHR
jgi:orotate phosphoribosyltransferase